MAWVLANRIDSDRVVMTLLVIRMRSFVITLVFISTYMALVARSHSAILHIYVPYPFVAIPVGFSMVKRSVDNCNFFKINQEEYTSPEIYTIQRFETAIEHRYLPPL